MKLREQLGEYVRACFTGLWIESHEHAEALREIAELCRDEQWDLSRWDITTGLSNNGSPSSESVSGSDPLTTIRSLESKPSSGGTRLLVLQNFHRFLQSAEIVQALSQAVLAGKQSRTILVILAPLVQLPVELEKLFVVLVHDLPGREQLAEIASDIATEEGELPAGRELEAVLDAASGLTRLEAENAFSLSLVREGRITAETVWELKTQTLSRSGLLTLHRGQDDFSRLGGLGALKAFCQRALRHCSRDNRLQRPRGILLLSPPGCGKSAFCKSLGRETGRPVLILDVGSLMGSLVGQSEERTRQALRIIDAMAPCVVMIEEAEKAFAGINGQGDSGVASRMFATFLNWLNDHESDVFVVCTANEISRLPPEFGRSERFDGVFFLDLPGAEEKAAIWCLYRGLFAIDDQQPCPDDTDWTGAEIRACCRLSALLDVSLAEAAGNIVPVAVTAAESVGKLRDWASQRCLSASQPGLYRRAEAPAAPRTRRRLNRDPSAN